MTTRSEREKAQRQNEEHQTILAELLRQEANKYCADCEAKGPRWASWNLGVFLCIRCAGIHRNLGVHISRVKSVNLDQWTQQQIQNMQELGNARAPQIYEGRLPPDFKRPQSDHAVEMFVRDKYEKKKYMDKNVDLNVLKQREKLKEKKNEVKPAVVEKARVEKSPEQQGMHKAVRGKTPGLDMDLLGLDAQGWNESPKSTPTGASEDLDIFGPMVSNPLPASTPTSQATVTTAAKPVNQGQPSANDLNLFLDVSTQSEDNSKKTMSKDSILSLYGNQHGQCVPQGSCLFASWCQHSLHAFHSSSNDISQCSCECSPKCHDRSGTCWSSRSHSQSSCWREHVQWLNGKSAWLGDFCICSWDCIRHTGSVWIAGIYINVQRSNMEYDTGESTDDWPECRYARRNGSVQCSPEYELLGHVPSNQPSSQHPRVEMNATHILWQNTFCL
uniref:Small ArfGAP 1 n=1 Tax=Eptatretus burgeri TaxID=7764 RepID=A0A8C4Q897_EPTBU